MGATTTPDRLTKPASQRYLQSLDQLLRYYQQRGLEGEDVTQAELLFADALARYSIARPPGKLLSERIHVMVFGGAGAGKSTTANILAGAAVAEVNAQAGYTRHPVAYYSSDETQPDLLWPESLGMLRRTDAAGPANVDDHRFGWRKLEESVDPGFLRRHVVWDCPDLTAKDSSYYQVRVIEIAALADVAVYVASDERYNDELPTNFLQALLSAGKHVVVVLTKADPDDANQFVQMFQEQVVANLTNTETIAKIVPIPNPGSRKAQELWTDAYPYGHELREAVENAAGDLTTARRYFVDAAGRYLRAQQSRILAPLRSDLGEWKSWMELVRNAANDAVKQYEREYLAGVKYDAFEKVLERLLSLFRLEGSLSHVWTALEIVRTPYRFVKSFWQRFSPVVPTEEADEDKALDRIRRGMLESLQIACATRKSRHRLWGQLHQALDEEVLTSIEPQYLQARARQKKELNHRVQAAMEEINESVEDKPTLVQVLRGGRTLIEITAVSLSIYVAYETMFVFAFILIPFALGLVDDLVRMGCKKFIHHHRAGLVNQQKDNIRELIQVAYIDPLLHMPKSRGEQLYQLSQLEEKLPGDLTALLDSHSKANA